LKGIHNSNDSEAGCDVLEEGFSSNARIIDMHVNNCKKVHDRVKSDKCRKEPEEDIENDLEDMFASICQIREEGGRKFKNIKEEEHNVNNDNQSEDSIEASAHDVFNDDSTSRDTNLTNGTRTTNTDDSTGGYDELDGFISYLKPYAQEK
jgi:hypothetical protein